MYESIYYATFAILLGLSYFCGFFLTCVYNKKKSDTNKLTTPICKNELCKNLEPLMVSLMVKKLSFKNESKESNDVKIHLDQMKKDVHPTIGGTNLEGKV